jgi:hypothetical protein
LVLFLLAEVGHFDDLIFRRAMHGSLPRLLMEEGPNALSPFAFFLTIIILVCTDP